MRVLVLPATVLSLCIASVAGAGLRYTQVSHGDDDGSNLTNEVMQADGKFKSIYIASDNPMFSAGFYTLATGPNAIYMVNPAKRKYARFSLKEMQSMSGANAAQAGMEAKVTDFKMTKDIDEDGLVMIGLPTRHYRYTVAYSETRQPPGSPMPMITNIVEVTEFWASKAAIEMTMPRMSDQGNSQLQEAQREMGSHGFVLKQVVTSKSKFGGMMGAMSSMMPKGSGGGDSKSTMEVTALDRNATFPKGTFDLPQGFAEVDMINLMSGGAMPDLSMEPPQ